MRSEGSLSGYLKDLPVLRVLAEELHFGRAAERMAMTQPQLSEIIRRIEQRAGFPIFIRRPRVRLTPAGELLVGATGRVLEDLGATVQRAQQLAAGQIGTVRLGYAPVAMLTKVPFAIRRFLSENPAARVKLIEAHSAALMSQLEKGALDMIVSRERARGGDMRSAEIAPDTVVAVVPADHPLVSSPEIDLASLRGSQFVMFEPEAAPDYHRSIVGLCSDAGFEPQVGQRANGWSTILALVANGFGVSLVSAALASIPFPGVAFLPITGRPSAARFWISWIVGNETAVSRRLRVALHDENARPAPKAPNAVGTGGCGDRL